MVGCARCSQSGHCIGKTPLRQCHHVHVAFCHQNITRSLNAISGFKQTIKFAAFVKHRGLRRIEVFGRTLPHHTAAKSDALTFDIANWEHHPIAKAVVTFLVFFIDDHQATLGQQRLIVVGKHAGQTAPTLGRVAQTKSFGNLTRQASAFEVSHGLGRRFQVVSIRFTGFFQDIA